MEYWTICGYDEIEGQNVVIKVQADSEDQAKQKMNDTFESIEINFLFKGKLDELTGDPECFEL